MSDQWLLEESRLKALATAEAKAKAHSARTGLPCYVEQTDNGIQFRIGTQSGAIINIGSVNDTGRDMSEDPRSIARLKAMEENVPE